MRRTGSLVCFLVGCGAMTDLGHPQPAQDAAVPDVAVVTECSPRDYTTNADPNGTFVVASGYVYFLSTEYWIARVATEGTSIESIVQSDALTAWTADETSVWYTANGNVSRVPSGGGSSEVFWPASNVFVVGITANEIIVDDETKHQFDALSKQDATLTPFFTKLDPAVSSTPLIALVGVDDHIFWMTDAHVIDAAINSLEPAEDDNDPSGLAMNGNDVYWTSLANGTNRLVHRSVTTTGQNIVFTGELRGPLGANASYVYGVTSGGVARISVSTGESTMIAPDVFPRRMVIDGACVYTIDTSGRVHRTPG